MNDEDIQLEILRTLREAEARVVAKLQSQQLGLAFVDLVVDRENDEGDEVLAA